MGARAEKLKRLWGNKLAQKKAEHSTGVGAALAACLLFALSGCAAVPTDPEGLAAYEEANDPLEPMNRTLFGIYQSLDAALIEPLAKGYDKLPDPIQNSVRNFTSNLREPVVFANDVLQGEMTRAGVALGRLTINSTIGILGLFDPATKMGLEGHVEDFGQTMAVWGVPEGAYVFLPLLGPMNVRDGFGLLGDLVLDPLFWIGDPEAQYVLYGRRILTGIDDRARNLKTLDELEKGSIDFYAAFRSLYRQNREQEIRNGEESFEDLPDFDEFE